MTLLRHIIARRRKASKPPTDKRLLIALGTVIRLGDRVRELEAWRRDYAARTGRAA